ncbi:hypothetical protein Fcan01_19274 [Folsomia candida]|uniref:Uncharacterized protein n=1 Tax=Folsomia candida TaxID=158441 RepID=A0A226DMW1_FOLCA|nr:hypothetical protein Fcan01_19274 [Folsomia candida]
MTRVLFTTNLSLVLIVFKLCNYTKIFPLQFNKKLRLSPRNRMTLFAQALPIITNVGHILGSLYCFLTKWLASTLPTWKFVLIAYTGFLYGVITVGLLHFERVKKDCVTLVNSCMEAELKVISSSDRPPLPHNSEGTPYKNST